MKNAMQELNFESLLSGVVKVVEAAGEHLISEWQRPDGPSGIGDKADVDVSIEEQLRPELISLLSCDFWGEETGQSLTGNEFCWVVDPNDGTADFLKGLKGSAISVGLLRNSQPVLGVVYAPVLDDLTRDCIAWAEGMPFILRNGAPIRSVLAMKAWSANSRVMVSSAAASKPEINSELCAPASFVAMPSIAYRLARVAVGDGDAAVSLYPVSAHDVVAGHALIIGAGGVFLDHQGLAISYRTEANMKVVSQRCFGGTVAACEVLLRRNWDKVLN